MKLRCPTVRNIPRATWEKGVRVEMEHTSDRKVARCIAAAHLEESSLYYDELAKMERRLRRGR